ncbi:MULTISPECIES: GNAT family N-acetyltransferase [Pseudoalteromonas]|uniref:GNAT family N-acetyltransferase n=1 Tax=Pseudoalteromonas amylolytica TaxID=1859457 RepID=A0A1S1MYX2_9GAMM|nr:MULTISPECIES: GNAT family N-acetyltransferase [Pseudoalteromonas]OHU90809.1 GNAT family N-acetyltransferase [Pseudoalteromonas sp. JW3]OHU92571.1 GNAT family N-acetyltransferase [Pseudoalteromonas amylolytica]
MEISLQEITKDNYEAVCDLDVKKEQEELVACNMWSLVESMFNDGYVTRAIYADNEAVGFLMWVKESLHKVSIWRFMIDQNHQQKGIGRVALKLALREIRTYQDLKEIEICYMPHNPVAKDFYASFGFVEIGMDEADEEMLASIKL